MKYGKGNYLVCDENNNGYQLSCISRFNDVRRIGFVDSVCFPCGIGALDNFLLITR